VGPDAFGYTLKDSNEVGGPTYQWEDISSTGTQVTGWFGTDDGYAGPVPIGFDFEFYETTYDVLYVGTNGYVSFGQGYGEIPWGSLPNTSWPNNDIALFGGDMYLYDYGNDSSVHYQTLSNPERFVLQFDNLYFCCGQNTPHTFQLILYPAGDMLVQYNELNGDSTSYVGIENADGTDGLSYGSTLADNLAIQYYYPTGVLLRPSADKGAGEPGAVITYEVSLLNRTGASDSFTLTLQSGNAWTATLFLTQTGTLSDNGSIDFELSVEIPPAAEPGDTDSVTIEAASHSAPGTYTDTATVTTVALGGELAYVALSNHDELALVDSGAGIVVDTIDLGPSGCSFPWRVAIPPDGQTVWVSCRDSGSVLVLERAGNSILQVVSGLNSPAGIAFTQDSAHALVGTRYGSDVRVVAMSG
jgi:DNA-binding beta-propeller fold protein YncE